MSHDTLDDRIRRGFHDLADAAGDAPPWPGTSDDAVPDRTGGRRSYGLVALVCTLVMMVGGLVVLAQRDDADMADRAVGATPFFGTRWNLTSVVADGRPLDVARTRIVWVFGEENLCRFGGPDCDTGPVVLGRDVCNQFERSISVDDGRVRWEDWGSTTLVGCQGELVTAFDRLRDGEGFSYAIVDDALRLSGSGIEMTFVAGPPLGDPLGLVLDEGSVDSIAYRVSWDTGVLIEWVDTSTASMVNSQGYAAMSDALSANFADFGVGRYLFAILPDAAVGAAYVTDDGTQLELSVLDHDAPLVAASRVFDGDPGPGRLVAFDAAGGELASVAIRGADQPGITSVPSASVPTSTAP